MREIALHIERLRRHHDASIRTYDAVSLLDLSHTLRVWADMKDALHKQVPAFSSTLSFKTSMAPKKVRKAAKQFKHVLAFMPGGTTTYAGQGQLFGSTDEADADKDFVSSAWIKINSDGSVEVKNYCFIAAHVDDEIRRACAAEEVTRCNYMQWLGAEAVRLGYEDESGSLQGVSLSREMMIRRMANSFDGSHPSVGEPPSTNRFDAPIRKLFKYEAAGLPLPYFILVKIAQDILVIANKARASSGGAGAA